MNKTGVFIARMQPIHNAHIWIIEKMLQECDNILIIIGSANKSGTLRNPFDVKFREDRLKLALFNDINLNEAFFTKRIKITRLPDLSTENDKNKTKEWGYYLYYNIVKEIEKRDFAIYYSDDPNIIKSWFSDDISKNIEFRTQDRSQIMEGLSSSKVREAILNNDINYINKYCPKSVSLNISYISKILNEIKENPKEDFSIS